MTRLSQLMLEELEPATHFPERLGRVSKARKSTSNSYDCYRSFLFRARENQAIPESGIANHCSSNIALPLSSLFHIKLRIRGEAVAAHQSR